MYVQLYFCICIENEKPIAYIQVMKIIYNSGIPFEKQQNKCKQ